MRAFAITGIDTAPTMPSIRSGSLIRATPPCTRMSAGTRSSAMTATAPASSAIFACSGVTTSMITPPLSISAMPRLTRAVPTMCSDMASILRLRGAAEACAGQTARRLVAWSAADRNPLADQHHPGVSRRERDAVAAGRTELGAVVHLGPRPLPVDPPAVAEHGHLAAADRERVLRRVAVDVR